MLSQKQVLVVEDNALNRELLIAILSDQYAVLEAKNGQEALDILKERGGDVALILLDVMMPVMDGYTFLDRVKQDAGLSLIPVIVTTQSDSEEDELAALSHGATDFVPKPYRPQVILHRVASIINLRETAAMVNQFQYDRLTGLYSKEFFYQKVREVLRDNPGREFDIVSSNVENFKLFNDTFGVPAGDGLLRSIAGLFVKQIGNYGISICGRFGADRFLCLAEHGTRYDDKVFFAIGEQINSMANAKNVVMKWGIYEITDRAIPVEHMCDRALLAGDSIKGQYNRFVAVYDDKLRSKLLRERAITESMESALAEGQFSVYLQPKYSLEDDTLAGAEALVRWMHPAWGFLSPGEFIPLFEKNGFITQLDQYVWEQVCVLLRRWWERGYPAIPVSVNVSRADVYRADLPETLLGIVRKHGVPPAQLHLEITESAYTENPAQIISTVGELRRLGFVIEMDDFGSGYSSLNMLGQMKLDILKLDMKFIQTETAKPGDQGILRFIVELARRMNLRVVAEGVETREQLERLREIGCDYAQGYFFARPMPSGDFEELLQNPPQKREAAAPAVQPPRAGANCLLVAEEDLQCRALIRQAFETQYEILEADDAAGALACAAARGLDIFAVILSLTLPENGTVEVLNALRRNPAAGHPPILATAPATVDPEKHPLAFDVDDIAYKPRDQLCLLCLRRRVAWLRKLSAYQEQERALQAEAYRDYLTGLLNRRGLQAAMNALRRDDLPLAVYLFDLDDLKKVNDTCGHEAGDAMLRTFGEQLRRYTRDGDILCRYGGDEFVVILRHISSVDTLRRKGREICGSLSGFALPDGLRASCSGGIALCGAGEKPSVELIERADQALYRAKRENKGGCFLWEEAAEN